MSRSYWNDIDRTSGGDIQGSDDYEEEYQNHTSHRYYPTQALSNHDPRGSSYKAVGTTKLPSRTPHTVDNTNESSFSRSSSGAAITTAPSTLKSHSSFYETLQAEAASLRSEPASCCPLCGFQGLQGTHLNNAGNRSLAVEAIANTARLESRGIHSDASPSVLLRSFVMNQQEQLLNGCNTFDALNTAGVSIPLGAEFPPGTCWVCAQAADNAAKERQVEEDRMLAASLSKIILEEQQNRPTASHSSPHPLHYNNINMNGDGMQTNPIHETFSSSGYYEHVGITNSMPQHRHQGPFQREGWPEERHATMHSASLPVNQGQYYDQSTNITNSGSAIANQDYNIDHDQSNVTVNDESCVYIGEYNVLGQRHGSRGELIWDSGDRYVGTFKNGMRSGQGAFFSRDGSEYTGDWKDNLMHGFGQCKFANGDTYVGSFVKGQRSGGPNCKYKFANSDLYVGGWKADQFHGFGRYFYADGIVLEGNFVLGVKQGKFKRQLPNEDLDILRFEADRLVGEGVRWNTKRTKTWLLELHNESSSDSKSKKKGCRRNARRIVKCIGNKIGCRQKKSAECVPSSVGTGTQRNETANYSNVASSHSSTFSLTPSSSLPHENLVPVLPLGITKNIKKSVRIPISRAVSIGYDCEIGTGARPEMVAVN